MPSSGSTTSLSASQRSSSLGLFYPWLLAAAAFILGAVSHRREFRFAAYGVILGTAIWWLLALMNIYSDAPSSGSGSS